MDTEATNQPSPEKTPTHEEIQARREKEMGQVISSILRGKYKETGPEDPTIQALQSSEYYANIGADELKNGPKEFPLESGSPQGEPIKVVVQGREAVLVQIAGVDQQDNLSCFTIFADEVGREDAVQHATTLTRQQMLDANLTSERDNIEKGFAGDKLDIIKNHLDSIDPNKETAEISDELTAKMEKVAKEQGMLTGSDLSQIIDKTVATDDPQRAEAQKVLDSLQGKTIVDKDDLHGALEAMGIQPEKFASQAETLRAEITKQKSILAEFPEDAMVQRKLDQLETQLTLLYSVDAIWSQAKNEGRNPLDGFFEKAQNGELAEGAMKDIITNIAHGDYDKIADQLIQLLPPEATEEEKKKLKKALEIAKVGGIGALWILFYTLAAAGAIGGASIAAAIKQSQ